MPEADNDYLNEHGCYDNSGLQTGNFGNEIKAVRYPQQYAGKRKGQKAIQTPRHPGK